jgi:hypothetical protein
MNLKNHFSHGNTRKTLKHSTYLERLFTPLAGDGGTGVKLMSLSVFFRVIPWQMRFIG